MHIIPPGGIENRDNFIAVFSEDELIQSVRIIADLAVSVTFNKYPVQSTSCFLKLVCNNTVTSSKFNTSDMTSNITTSKFTTENPKIAS